MELREHSKLRYQFIVYYADDLDQAEQGHIEYAVTTAYYDRTFTAPYAKTYPNALYVYVECYRARTAPAHIAEQLLLFLRDSLELEVLPDYTVYTSLTDVRDPFNEKVLSSSAVEESAKWFLEKYENNASSS